MKERQMIMSSIFLSHNSKDKPFVRKLADDLRKNGHYVWVDEAEIKVGDSLIGKIEEGIENTEYLGVVISSNSNKSEWVIREVRTALSQEIYNKKVKVLPILIENVEMPSFLLDKKYADFTLDDNYENALQSILDRLSELPSGIEKSLFSKEEVKFYKQQLENLKERLNVKESENARLIGRLEKERKNISPSLKKLIEDENESFPELADVNRLYAFETSFSAITAGYLLHGLRKEYMKGRPHQIAIICEMDNKTDELVLLMGATLERLKAINKL